MLEMRDVQTNDKIDGTVSPTAISLYDSDSDLDEFEDLDLEATSKWWPILRNHSIALLFLGGVFVVALWCLVYFLDIDYTAILISSLPREAVWDKNLSFLVLLWGSLVSCFGVLFSLLLSVVPAIILSFNKLIVPGKLEATKGYIEAFQELHSIFFYSITATFGFILYCLLLRNSVTMDLDIKSTTVTIYRVLFCFIIICCFVAFEKFLIQLISVRFHRTAYNHRLEEARFATNILDKLNTAVSKKGLSYSKIIKIEHSRAALSRGFTDREDGNSDSDYGDYGTDVSFMQGPNSTTMGSKANSQRGTAMNVNFEPSKKTDEDASSFVAARKLARKIYFSLQRDRRQLSLEEFLPWFKNQEEAEQAFKFFDKDGNGDVSRREMRDAILRTYKERKDLVKALRDTSQVVGKLDKFLFLVALFLAGATCGILFGKDASKTLITVSACFLAVTFMIGENAKQFVQSIIFLFVMHPYDVGDRVYIDALVYFVKKVGLLGTEFRCTNGQITYIPHYILITKIIYNARRSDKQVDTIDFLLSYDTPKEKLVMLKEHINEYIDEVESREFSSNPLLVIDAIENCNKLKMSIKLEHKSNWQDNTKRNIRKTRFLVKLRDICSELGLSYSLPIQKVIHMDGSTY